MRKAPFFWLNLEYMFDIMIAELMFVFKGAGWLVLRFWESDIKKNMDGIIAEIMKYLP
ncbi:DUF559 domain-containing protein [Anaerovibrio lipolyticus]|uniref:DUF559 domain-containing protein n=1 Tax=Anaerovibrio lipolyticus TaxID=82374 RepID=UPI001177BAE4|nr:DUF559 domain-containing protein [Anaerovibrio lipolyticus]